MRGRVPWLALLPIVLILAGVPAFAGPAVEISTDPPGARILVNGTFTGVVTDQPASVTFPKPADYDVTLVLTDYVPLTVRIAIPLWGSAQKASFKLERVGRTEWLSWKALPAVAAPLVAPFVVALLLTWQGRVHLINAWTFGTLGAVIGVLVGLSQTPVVAVAIQFVLVFLGGFAGYWMGDKDRNGRREPLEIGAYLLNFTISFVVALYLGGYYRDLDRFFTGMRATYWGLSSTSSATPTAGPPATGQHLPATGQSPTSNGRRAPASPSGPGSGASTDQSSAEQGAGKPAAAKSATAPGAPSPDPPAPGTIPMLPDRIVPPPGPGFIAPVCRPRDPNGHC